MEVLRAALLSSKSGSSVDERKEGMMKPSRTLPGGLANRGELTTLRRVVLPDINERDF